MTTRWCADWESHAEQSQGSNRIRRQVETGAFGRPRRLELHQVADNPHPGQSPNCGEPSDPGSYHECPHVSSFGSAAVSSLARSRTRARGPWAALGHQTYAAADEHGGLRAGLLDQRFEPAEHPARAQWATVDRRRTVAG